MKKLKSIAILLLAVVLLLGCFPVASAQTAPFVETNLPIDAPLTHIDFPATPTDVTPTDILYGDVYEDEQINAKDALWVLKYCVGKQDLTPNQLIAADFSYQVYQTENHLGVDAKDALIILQCAASCGPFRPQLMKR